MKLVVSASRTQMLNTDVAIGRRYDYLMTAVEEVQTRTFE